MDQTFQTMEARLFRGIMNPAMIAAFVLGLWLIWIDGHDRFGTFGFLLKPWMLTKLAGVVFLLGYHHFLGVSRKAFAQGRNRRSEGFWRLANEAPFVAAIVMVLAVTTEFGG
jgi:protoporphyrinogen IX oxidase